MISTMGAEVRWLCFSALIFCLLRGILSNAPFSRFEYKLSFKPPYLAQKDGKVPFWEYGGNAIASSQNVRVAPSLRSQKGAIWSKLKTNFQWWEVDILFRVTGRGRIGADGLAFWFTQNKGDYDGEVFGSSDKWVGLGVFFDSFDNDNKHNNPYIMAVINDGTRQFDHANDGGSQMIGGCLRDFRNKPFPTRAKIEYYMNTLTVMFHNGNTNNEADMEVCLRVEGVTLPSSGHFGLSAATGGLADDHDVLHFLTTSLYPPGTSPQGAVQGQPQVSPEDHEKLAKEYADYQRKLEQQKEDYRKEHPEVAKDSDADLDEWYETDSQRELRQIFAGQSQDFLNAQKANPVDAVKVEVPVDNTKIGVFSLPAFRPLLSSETSPSFSQTPSTVLFNPLKANPIDEVKLEAPSSTSLQYHRLQYMAGGLFGPYNFIEPSFRFIPYFPHIPYLRDVSGTQVRSTYEVKVEVLPSASRAGIFALPKFSHLLSSNLHPSSPQTQPSLDLKNTQKANPVDADKVEVLQQTSTPDTPSPLTFKYVPSSKLHPSCPETISPSVIEQVRVLSQKLDEVIGRQERSLSMLSSIQSAGLPPAQIVQTPGGQPQVVGDTIRRHEVDSILNNQNTLLMLAREIRGYVVDVQVKSDNIISNQARAPTAQVQSVGYDMVSLVHELRDGLNTVKRDAATTAQKLSSPPPPSSCPSTSCVSLPIFIFVALAQLLCFIGYSMYRDNKEAQAKKFY